MVMLGRLAAAFSRAADKVPAHVPDVVLGLNDPAPLGKAVPLALQQIALQSVYFVLPGVVAAAYGGGALEATNYLCLSLLGLALFAVLSALRRGPIGPGYPVVATPSAVLFGPLIFAASQGATMGHAVALTILTGLATALVAPMMRRIVALMPTEVTGVVVFMIGASLLPGMMSMLRLDPAAQGDAVPQVVVAFGAFVIMVVVAVLRWRFAPYAVLIGAAAGTVAAVMLGMVSPDARQTLVRAPWFALPAPPAAPDFGFPPALAVSFLLSLVASLATAVGVFVAFQRATDGSWTRPDAGPIRRGILAQGIALMLTGLAGGMGTAPSASCAALSIATRTFARRIALVGAAILAALAVCPKAVALIVLVPAPVQAAMLLYVAGFMMAQGCAMVVQRTLDTRRTIVAGLGLTAGLAVLAAPRFFAVALPALAAPLAMGALVAFLANLVTLPLVKRIQSFRIPLGKGASDLIEDRAFAVGGAWGLRSETVRKVHHALTEIGDLLAARGLAEMTVTATQQEETVVVTVAFAGPPLPLPARRPRAEDIEAGGDALEAVSLWLALREATRHAMRRTAEGQEVRLEFLD